MTPEYIHRMTVGPRPYLDPNVLPQEYAVQDASRALAAKFAFQLSLGSWFDPDI